MLSAFLNFDTFLFPKIAKIIYWIGLVLIGLGTLVSMFSSLAAIQIIGGGTGFLGFIVALSSGIIGVVVWRVVVEVWLVLFSILDTLKEIRDRAK